MSAAHSLWAFNTSRARAPANLAYVDFLYAGMISLRVNEGDYRLFSGTLTIAEIKELIESVDGELMGVGGGRLAPCFTAGSTARYLTVRAAPLALLQRQTTHTSTMTRTQQLTNVWMTKHCKTFLLSLLNASCAFLPHVHFPQHTHSTSIDEAPRVHQQRLFRNGKELKDVTRLAELIKKNTPKLSLELRLRGDMQAHYGSGVLLDKKGV